MHLVSTCFLGIERMQSVSEQSVRCRSPAFANCSHQTSVCWTELEEGIELGLLPFIMESIHILNLRARIKARSNKWTSQGSPQWRRTNCSCNLNICRTSNKPAGLQCHRDGVCISSVYTLTLAYAMLLYVTYAYSSKVLIYNCDRLLKLSS